jgi:hypothetical protein
MIIARVRKNRKRRILPMVRLVLVSLMACRTDIPLCIRMNTAISGMMNMAL